MEQLGSRTGANTEQVSGDRTPRHEIIRLSCEGGGFPGGGWSSTLEFRPLARGFSVWETVIDPKPSLRRMVTSAAPLIWRNAAAYLIESCKFPLGGGQLIEAIDMLESIDVEGVASWQADLLRMSWVRNDDLNAQEEPQFLLKLPDVDIERLWNEHGSFISEAALSELGYLMNAIAECGFEKLTPAELATKLGVGKNFSISRLLAAIEPFQDAT